MFFCSSYEQAGKAKRVVKAQQLWYAIIESQTETGTPYMLYKDACNRKSNQQNLGTIKCSNLCTEIVEYTSKDEVKRVQNTYTKYNIAACLSHDMLTLLESAFTKNQLSLVGGCLQPGFHCT